MRNLHAVIMCAAALCVGSCQGSKISLRSEMSSKLSVANDSAESKNGPILQICKDSVWVYCGDAECEQPVDGVSTCSCFIQNQGWSIAPTSHTGAPKVLGQDASSMCEEMQDGALYSTFGFDISYSPAPAAAACPAGTSFAYCWGAVCQADPNDPTLATCACPITTSESKSSSQILMLPKSDCGVIANPCDTSSVTYNSGDEAMFTVFSKILGSSAGGNICYSAST